MNKFGTFSLFENFKSEEKDGFVEFEDAREVVQNLMDEYAAAEKEDYISWGSEIALEEKAITEE